MGSIAVRAECKWASNVWCIYAQDTCYDDVLEKVLGYVSILGRQTGHWLLISEKTFQKQT